MTFQFDRLYRETQQALSADPNRAVVTFTADSRQQEGLRSAVQVRGFEVPVDEPTALGGTDTAPNPVEYVLAALAACQEITYRLYADALGIPLDGVAVRIDGDVDLRGFFAVDPSVRPGFGDVSATVTLDSPAPETDLRRLKAAVDRHCPVLDILRNPTPVHLGLEFAGRAAPCPAA